MMEEQPPAPEPIPRREFVKVAGAASIAASTWWAVTQKTDALALPLNAAIKGPDSLTQNYDYEVL